MKNLLTLALFFLLISCNQENNEKYTIISGTIKNTSEKNVMLYNAYNSDFKKEIPLTNGQFTDTIELKGNLYFIVENKSIIKFYAEEGDNINLNYNAKHLDSTLTFSGDNVAENTYIAKSKNAAKDIQLDIPNLYTKAEGDFVENVNKIKQKQEDFLFNSNGLSKGFIEKEKAHINYQFLSSLGMYQTYHSYFTKNKDFKASDTINAPLKKIKYTNLEDFIYSDKYRSLIETILRKKAIELTKEDTNITSDVAYFNVLSDLENEEIRNYLAYNSAKFGITFTKNLEDYYAMFNKVSTNEANNKKITESYTKLKALAKGSPSPEFTDYENNAGGSTSLTDLEGKYVYIDVWATWCGPCIAEIPSLKKIEKEYHDKNIEFVSISIDKMNDYDKWKKVIVSKELGGMQLLADKDWDSQFIQDYLIKGIPHFILIDPKGNIVESNAPRPSSTELPTIFDELKI